MFAREHGKPFSLPEWGLRDVDDPAFIRYICDFIRSRAGIELAAYFESKPGSRYDLANKPKSRQAYRDCIAPLGATPPAPPQQAPPTGAQLRLTATPMSGPAPLGVEFGLFVNLPQPVAHWQLVFGDGTLRQGDGKPPASAMHTYAKDGVYRAVLIVYLAPPFTGTAIRLLTQVDIKVGEEPGVLLRLDANPRSGRAPLKVVFTTTVNIPRPIVRWQLLYGDGLEIEGTGKPPRFLGHTYARKGVFRAVLITWLGPPFTGTAVRFLTYVDIRVT